MATAPGNGPTGMYEDETIASWLPITYDPYVWRRTNAPRVPRTPISYVPPFYYCTAFFPQNQSASVRQGVTVNTLRPGALGIGDGT